MFSECEPLKVLIVQRFCLPPRLSVFNSVSFSRRQYLNFIKLIVLHSIWELIKPARRPSLYFNISRNIV